MGKNKSLRLSLIVAAAENGAIGKDNKMPWHLPADLQYFKKVTMGKPVVMGRKTFESIGQPLPGRTNIVITRDKSYRQEGVEVLHDLSAAEAACEDFAVFEDFSEMMFIGGAEIYKQVLPEIDRIYLTQVHAEFEADTYFPELEKSKWTVVSEQRFAADDKNPYDYSFIVMERGRR